jgi:hypothetical protein
MAETPDGKTELRAALDAIGPFYLGLDSFNKPAYRECLIRFRKAIEALPDASPAPDLSALREAFRAGFLAVHRAEGPYHMTRVWTFDGVAAADLEPEAWEAYKAQLAGLSRPEGK